VIARKLSASTRDPRTAPFVRHTIFRACLAFGPFVVGCGGRWTPEAEYAAQSNTDAASAYAKLLKVLGDRGYHVTEQRDADHYVQVRAHIDEKFVAKQSFIAAQVDPAGVVHFTPSGHLVHENHVHKKLASELLDLQYAMRGDVGAAPVASAAPSAPAPPTSAAPPPPATAAPTAAAPTATAAPAVAAIPVATPSPAPAPKTSSKPKSSSTSTSTTTPAPKPSPKPASDDWEQVK
jgi:hypothetical protein